MCKVCGIDNLYALQMCRHCYEKDLRQRNVHYHERQKENSRKWHKKNKERKSCLDKQYRQTHIEQTNKSKQKYLLKKYGITIEEYNILLEKQNGVCAICKRLPGKKRLAVDHCHKTKRVRGLLCFRCNYGLSWYNDSEERLFAAYEYIKSSRRN